jgi:hypothetical protein
MLMLIHTSDPRYGGAPDPDEERERRWEPISLRLFLPMAGSLSCITVSAVTSPAVTYALDVAAIALCLVFVRAAWPKPDVGRASDEGLNGSRGNDEDAA